MTQDKDNCYDCGGDVEVETVGNFRDWVCQDCGIIIDSEKVVEDQQTASTEDDFEVME